MIVITLKKALLRGCIGIPIGVTISYFISIIFSAIYADGYFSPCSPDFIKMFGNEINGVIAQFVLSSIIGFVFASSTAVFEIEHFSITKQTFIHSTVLTFVFFPIAIFLNWIPFSFGSILISIAIFICIYISIWFFQYRHLKSKINNINSKLGIK